tara:strand:+ start:21059 stop:21391 length:333 start_codon:yes stop_codon:yes gene_type:complete
MFLASFQDSLISVDYYLNRTFYEANCVNKNKPDLDCHGKCVMEKEMESNKLQIETIILGFEFNILPQQTLEIPKPQYLLFKENSARFRNREISVITGFSRILIQPPQSLA